MSELGTCSICGRTKKALWDGPYDDELYCVSGMTTNHPAGAALPCYRRAYEKLKRDIAAAEERGRRRGVEEAAKIASGYTTDPEARNIHPDIAFKDMNETAQAIAHTTAQGIAMAILDLAPRDSGKERLPLPDDAKGWWSK